MPVALIIAGSGPTDRNGNNPMAKNASLELLSDALSNAGIATLRYDKRGIVASAAAMKSESELRFDDYVQDAAGWVKLLKSDKRFSKVYVIGHSEGSLIGMLASKTAAGFISIAGAGFPAQEILKKQLNTLPENLKTQSFSLIDSLSAGFTVSSAPLTLYSLFRPSVQPYMISWFKYNPRQLIKSLTAPVLLLQGTNDLQVTVEDARALKEAKPEAKLVLIENMNHVLRIVEGDRNANLKTYSNASLPLAPQLSESIIQFIKKGKK
ncbi:MAG: alpha/beta fold hydrolase [Flaviaesturariibacter sp.]|nr:alpha/beta fold hydrolase [Flaviaesturariibacter sp.]